MKTLKDLDGIGYGIKPGFYSDSYMIDSHKLRQEAIKWVNKWLKESDINNSKDFDAEYYMMKQTKIRWVMYFFNITKEDLE